MYSMVYLFCNVSFSASSSSPHIYCLSMIVMASEEEEEEMVSAEMGSPLLQKKSSLAGSLDPIPSRIGNSHSPEPSNSKADAQDAKSECLCPAEAAPEH